VSKKPHTVAEAAIAIAISKIAKTVAAWTGVFLDIAFAFYYLTG